MKETGRRSVTGPVTIDDFLSRTIQLTAQLAELHARDAMHGSLGRDSLSIAESGQVTLASPSVRPVRDRLAYLSPEETGRTTRAVDMRSDLYSMGVIFYELLTGRLPFNAGDPLEWVHAHLARRAIPPAEVLLSVPSQLSAITMRLLAKLPEERYQSAAGLLADLERCRASWQADHCLEEFPLGERDVSDQLVLSQRLHGRGRELAQLERAWRHAGAEDRVQFAFVAGPAGIGKSVLVHELSRRLAGQGEIFVSGKFEQLQGDQPYSGIARVLSECVHHALGASDERLAHWRDQILDAVELNGRLLIDLVPELRMVIGEQPPASELPAPQARQRFERLVGRFLTVFAASAHPLVIFLDDLQWADPASLAVLEALREQLFGQPVLVIAAYRDLDPEPQESLAGFMARVSARMPTTRVRLGPLAVAAVAELLADTLHLPVRELMSLATVLANKTAGHPLFLGQLLGVVHAEGSLRFDPVPGGWTWDLKAIRRNVVTDNVVAMIAARISTLDAQTRELLAPASCMGSLFDVATLARVVRQAQDQVARRMRGAIREGVVIDLRRLLGGPADAIVPQRAEYRWAHDGVQQAVHSLIPPGELPRLRLAIGQAMLSSLSADGREQRIFELVNHLNAGSRLLSSRQERRRLAALNLEAGRRAVRTGAYSAARDYLETAADQLTGSFDQLAFDVHLERAKCTALAGDDTGADQRLQALLARSRSDLERARVLNLQSTLVEARGGFWRAVEIGLEVLRLLGIEVPKEPAAWPAAAAAVHARLRKQLENMTDDDLLDLRPSAGPVPLAAEQFRYLVGAAHVLDLDLTALLTFHSVELSLRWRDLSGAAIAYSRYAAVLLWFGDEGQAERFAVLARRVLERGGAADLAGATYTLTYMVDHWLLPLGRVLALCADGVEAARLVGDLRSLAANRQFQCVLMLDRGVPLPKVATEAALAAMDAEATGFPIHAAVDRMLHEAASELASPLVTTLPPANEAVKAIEREIVEGRYRSPFGWVSNVRLVQQARRALLLGEAERALELLDRFDPVSWGAPATYVTSEHCFYRALALAAVQESRPVSQQERELAAIEASRERLRGWSQRCPANFQHRFLLVAAEAARLRRRPDEALALYRQAADSAAEHGFVQVEALARELTSQHYRRLGRSQEAIAELRLAHLVYGRWGADLKVRQMEGQHVELAAGAPGVPSGERLDLLGVIKASRAISEEIDFDRLPDRLLTVMVEEAGAERGVLLLLQGGRRRALVEVGVLQDRLAVRRSQQGDAVDLPEAIVNYVLRTGERVILDDTQRLSGQLLGQAGVDQPRSLVCFPITPPGVYTAVVYLEHRLLTGVFSAERISVLEHLAAQAAISLQNAGLFSQLRAEGEALRKAEARFRIAFEDAPIGMAILDPAFRVLQVNRSFTQMLEYPESKLKGTPFTDLLEAEERDSELTRELMLAHQVECRFRHARGHRVWTLVSMSSVGEDSGHPATFLVQLQDISVRRQLMDTLEHQAVHDALTGLPNRALLNDRLQVAISRLSRHGGCMAVFFIDLDRFKLVNDSLGHAAGDQVLAAVAGRLRAALRPEDTAARLSGDEFVGLCEEVEGEKAVLDIVNRISAAFESPFLLDGREAYVTASIGIDLVQPGDQPEAVLRRADAAMYRAKTRGGARHQIFDKAILKPALERLQLESSLRHVLERRELRLVYQPVVDLRTRQLRGIEALVRWQRPGHGLVEPRDFIQVAEETGLIVPIGAWVMETAWRQAARWRRRWAGNAPRVWLNLSGRQLMQPDLATTVGELLGRLAVEPGQVGLEITESVLMEDAETTRAALSSLRGLGLSVGIDDFGTGYSSLAYLKDFLVDALKIAGSFVVSLGQDSKDSPLVGAVIAMAGSLGLEVIAEGVETETALAELRRLGCSLGQGYLFGRPVPAEAIELNAPGPQ